MAMRTEETIDKLNGLIRVCRDGEELCGCGGVRASSAALRALLLHRSEEWGRLGDELQALVLLLGGEPVTSASFAARARRMRLALRVMLSGRNDAPLMDAWQRAQQRALRCYAEALGGYLPERIRRTIGLQADRVMDRCDQIGTLRVQLEIHSPAL